MTNFDEILKRIKERYPKPKIEIDFNSPYELLIGLVLSARCRDDTANKISAKLFEYFPSPKDMANATVDEINELIFSCTMHNTKAKNIKKIAEILCERYRCSVPNKFEDLIGLPGVADKTANMVLSFGFNIPAVGVDTHVLRTANRLGISSSKKPKVVEEDIKRIYPREDWIVLYAGLILLGRYICKAKNPLCSECFLNDICRKNGV